MKENLHKKFIAKLEEKYGPWEKETAKFGESSFGTIADDLCISKSQFTMLISEKATEGMYIRSIKNVGQLIAYDRQLLEIKELRDEKKRSFLMWIAGLVSLLFIIGLLAYSMGNHLGHKTIKVSETHASGETIEEFKQHPLFKYFDCHSRYACTPAYLSNEEVNDYCPCSGYEGEWELAEAYIIQLSINRPRFYYVAKSADVRLKCQKGVENPEEKGKILMGFEYMHNEIWVDTVHGRNLLDSIPDNTDTLSFLITKMQAPSQLRKVCDVNSFFYDQFHIGNDRIVRRGEPLGRIAENIDSTVVTKQDIDIKKLIESVISSMKQIECQPAVNHNCDPNTLQEGVSTLDYNCIFKMENDNYPYQKRYRLVKQNYANKLSCKCEE